MKKLICIVLAFVSTLGFNLSLNKDLTFLNSLSGNDIQYFLIFIALVFIINKALQNKDKRLNIISIILGLLFSVAEILGHTIVNYGGFAGILTSNCTVIKNIIKFLSYLIVSYSLIKLSFEYLSGLLKTNENKKYKIFTNNKLSIIIVAIILLVCWLPYFLKYYPGILGVDSTNQLEQATGIIGLSAHHPIVITLMIKSIITITMPIFNSMIVSVAICIFLKLIIMAFTISFALYYLGKKNVSNMIKLIILAFFAINPLVPLYGVSLDKDSLFACILLIDTILIFELVTNTEVFLKSKLKIFSAFICIVLTVFIRNNGLYILILTIPFIYACIRKNYIKLTVFFATTLIFIYLTNTLIFGIFHVGKSSIIEMMSIPIQAISRLVKYNGDNLTEKEKDEIKLFMNYDQLADSYNPNLSDSEKGNISEEYLKKHMLKYVALNVKLFVHHPSYYVESILCNTSGYWYPENRKLMFERGIVGNKFNIKTNTLIKTSWFEELDWGTEKREIPVIGMLFSSGFSFWMFLFVVFFTIYTKKYKLIIAELPILINYIIVIAGPSNTEFRYILPMYFVLPIILSLVVEKQKIK